MSWNAQINSDFWIDEYTANLDPIEKTLFIYLLTSPHGNISGIYQIPVRNIATDTGIEKEMVIKILGRFQKDGKVLYRDGWVCIKNRIKWNKMSNPSISAGVATRIKNCPDFITEFLELDTNTDRVYTGCPFPDKDIDKNKDKDIDKDSITKIKKINPVALWCEKFKAKFGEQYIATPKDAGHLNRVYKLIPEQFESKIDAFFEVDNFAHEWNVSIFQATLNKIKPKEKPSEYACTEERLEEMLKRSKQ